MLFCTLLYCTWHGIFFFFVCFLFFTIWSIVETMHCQIMVSNFFLAIKYFKVIWVSEWSHSVVSDSLRPHGPWPTRLLCPWNFPGKSTGVGCHFLLQVIYVLLKVMMLLHTNRVQYNVRILFIRTWKPKKFM